MLVQTFFGSELFVLLFLFQFLFFVLSDLSLCQIWPDKLLSTPGYRDCLKVVGVFAAWIPFLIFIHIGIAHSCFVGAVS